MNPRLFTFVGGTTGPWVVTDVKAVVGEPLSVTQRLDIINGAVSVPPVGSKWMLRGVTSNERYATRS